MQSYSRLPTDPGPADVLAAALSRSPFDKASVTTQNGKEGKGTEEGVSVRAGSIRLGPSHSKSHWPLEARSKQHAASEGIIIARWVVLPDSHSYTIYWNITVAAAFLTAIIEPFLFAFKDSPGLSPYLGVSSWIECLMTLLFGVDIALSFFVAYHDSVQQVLVTDPDAIRRHYLRLGGFWVDVLGVIPFDAIALLSMGLQDAAPDSVAACAVGALRWLRLVRCRRVLDLFEDLEFDVRISQIWVTLARNQFFLFFLLHASACTFFWIARLHRFSSNSWVGSSYNYIADMDTASQYAFSLYWSTITFSTVGYGDLHAVSTIEAVFTVIYCFINVVVSSYIIGTITVLVVKRDETTRDYRSRLAVLDAYNREHDLPPALTQSMSDHLELHLHSAEVRDEAVLSVYPATIRRRILRYLYSPILSRCQLLVGCPPRFLDTLLAVARVELFMGKVEVLSEGDHVHDLHILLAGSMEQLRCSGGLVSSASVGSFTRATSINGLQISNDKASNTATSSELKRHDSVVDWGLQRQDSAAWVTVGDNSTGRGRRRLILSGVAFGELPFFTQTTVQEAVRTLEVCRVLVVSRTAWQQLVNDFPLAATHVMSNLQVSCELEVVQELRGIMVEAAFRPPSASSPPSGAPAPQTPSTTEPVVTGLVGDDDTTTSLDDLQAAVYQLMYRHNGGSSSSGGCSAGGGGGLSAAFVRDGEPKSPPPPLSALSARQRAAVADLMRVRALASAQADATHAARTNEFLSAASRGDATRVREMLMQGQSVDVADYDDRTALMLACANGHVSVVRMLLDVGADPRRRDALGGTAALGAAKAGHDSVLQVLWQHGASLSLEPVILSGVLCRCAAEGDVPLMRRLLSVGADANARDYDGRTPLHVAAGCSNQPAVQLLLRNGADALCEDNFGSTPLDDARRSGSVTVVTMLEASLPTPEDARRALAKFELRRAERLLQACVRGDEVAVRQLLDSGCPVDACDYDARSGLELAASTGQLGVVRLLLSRGADVNRCDRVDSCALLEACKAGQRIIIEELVKAGGRLGSSFRVAALLCQAAASNNVTMLEYLLLARADPVAADYDKRTAAHIAAADGHMLVLTLLLSAPTATNAEEAAAVADAVRRARDRWEHTPYDEARAGGHWKCAELLLYSEARSM